MIFPDLRALDTHIKAGALLPVYLLYGEENRQIEAARDRLVKTIVPEEKTNQKDFFSRSCVQH